MFKIKTECLKRQDFKEIETRGFKPYLNRKVNSIFSIGCHDSPLFLL